MKKALMIVLILAGIFGAVLFTTRGMDEEKSTSSNTQPTEQNSSEPEKPTDTKQTEQATAIAVEIKNFEFTTGKLTIKKGTTVTWVNKDDASHDITPTSGGSDFVPSQLLTKGESYQFTFNTVGKYEYKCSPHPYMTGTIEVTE